MHAASTTTNVITMYMNMYMNMDQLIHVCNNGNTIARDLYDNVFMMPERGVADKFEVMCVVCLASQLTSVEKMSYLFDIFNFNSKGFLVRSEIIFLIVASIKGSNRVDKSVKILSDEQIETLIEHIFSNYAVFNPLSLRKPEIIKCGTETLDIRLFFDSWRGHSGQVLLKVSTCILYRHYNNNNNNNNNDDDDDDDIVANML